LSALNVARANLGLNNPVDESTLAAISDELGSTPEEATLSHLHDQRRRLEAIAREAERNTEAGEQQNESALASAHQAASERLRLWQQQFEGPIRDLRARVARVLPNIDRSRSDTEDYQRLALAALREQKKQAEEQSARAAQGARRQAEVADELSVARKNLQTVDEEIGRIATNSGSLAAILAELTSLISTDVCPVCDRDFTEEGSPERALRSCLPCPNRIDAQAATEIDHDPSFGRSRRHSRRYA
jgi:DNA repair protein SbcC/Rad50